MHICTCIIPPATYCSLFLQFIPAVYDVRVPNVPHRPKTFLTKQRAKSHMLLCRELQCFKKFKLLIISGFLPLCFNISLFLSSPVLIFPSLLTDLNSLDCVYIEAYPNTRLD